MSKYFQADHTYRQNQLCLDFIQVDHMMQAQLQNHLFNIQFVFHFEFDWNIFETVKIE